MSNFIDHLLSRHLETDKNVKPRVRGIFEPAGNSPMISTEDNLSGQNKVNENVQWHDQEPSNITSSAKPNRPSDQSTVSFKISEETVSVNAEPLKSFAPYRSHFKNNSKLQLKKETVFDQIAPSPIVQPAVNAVKPNTSTPAYPETIAADGEDSWVKTGIEENRLPINPISYSHETVKPIAKRNTRERADYKNKLPGQFQHFQDFHRTSGQVLNETTQPVIKVTIGRVEIRAVVQAAPSPVKSTATAKPKLSLEDYLKQQK